MSALKSDKHVSESSPLLTSQLRGNGEKQPGKVSLLIKISLVRSIVVPLYSMCARLGKLKLFCDWWKCIWTHLMCISEKRVNSKTNIAEEDINTICTSKDRENQQPLETSTKIVSNEIVPYDSHSEKLRKIQEDKERQLEILQREFKRYEHDHEIRLFNHQQKLGIPPGYFNQGGATVIEIADK